MTAPADPPPIHIPPPPPIGLGCLAALGALVGAIVVPAVVLLIEIVLYKWDPHCGAAGDEGGCAMGVASNTIMAVPFGLVVGLIGAIVIGRRGRRGGGG
jgi:hypothetical protein